MIVSDLIAALSRRSPDRRVVIPGQEWGWRDLAGVHAQLLTFAPMGDPAMGAWVAEYREETTRHHERCVVLIPHPAIQRLRSGRAHGDLRKWYPSNPAASA
jgi:hypothetical protein